MPKFKEGDIVYCTIPLDKWDDSITVDKCGDGEEEMKEATGGHPLVIESVGHRKDYQSYRLSSTFWQETWWFHEDDLEFFNLSLENK